MQWNFYVIGAHRYRVFFLFQTKTVFQIIVKIYLKLKNVVVRDQSLHWVHSFKCSFTSILKTSMDRTSYHLKIMALRRDVTWKLMFWALFSRKAGYRRITFTFGRRVLHTKCTNALRAKCETFFPRRFRSRHGHVEIFWNISLSFNFKSVYLLKMGKLYTVQVWYGNSRLF